MLRLILHALLLLEFIHVCHAVYSNCYTTNYTKYSCKRRVMILIDGTPPKESILRRVEFLTATAIIQRLDIQEDALNVGLAIYGENSFTINNFCNDRDQICVKLRRLWRGLDSGTSASLSRSIGNLFENPGLDDATLITVTGDSNQSDVDTARELIDDYIRKKMVWNFSSMVINLGSSVFHEWLKHSNVYNEYPNEALEKLDAVTDFANLAICGGHGIHNKRTTAATTPKPAMTATTAPGPTDIPPSLTTITTAVETTAEPTSTTTVRSTIKHITTTRSPKATSCDCSPESVWLDIFILMDASVHMTLNGIESATDYLMSAFAKMTIGQGERFQTRVGVIHYATNVKLIADLNVYKSTTDYASATDLSDLDISMAKETGTNIEGAIRLATSKFSSPSHRAAARPVLVIVGSSYRDGNYKDPTQIAREFRESGGIIITIEYVQEHGITVPMLQKLASPNFSLTTKKKDGSELHAQELRQLLCEANCFCKKNWMPFNTNKWSAPYGGCYYKSPANTVQMMANRRCRRWNATLMVDEDSSKDAFLIKAFPENTSFWLGLQYKDNKWTWPGGKPVSFTKWAPGQPNLEAGHCAYMKLSPGSKSAWFADDCKNDHKYICEAKACDSTTYCPIK